MCKSYPLFLGGLLSMLIVSACLEAQAHAPPSPTSIREAPLVLAVRKELPAPPRGVTELKFNELFKMPIGPRGLEPSKKLKALNGKRVRVIGFMVQQKDNLGGFLFSPLPVAIGAEDESLADDLPPGLIRVDLHDAPGAIVPHLPGLLQISGVLRIDARIDPDQQRISFVQLVPDEPTRRALLSAAGIEHADDKH